MQLNEFLELPEFGAGCHTALILRGLPGAGKSTLLNKLQHRYPDKQFAVASADAERIGRDGVYRWKPGFEAHYAANRNFLEALQSCACCYECWCSSKESERKRYYNVVAIDNTNIELIHIAPYVSAAASYGFKPLIVNIECDPLTSIKRNTHAVPEAKIMKWHQRLTQIKLPKEWPCVTLEALASPEPIGQDK